MVLIKNGVLDDAFWIGPKHLGGCGTRTVISEDLSHRERQFVYDMLEKHNLTSESGIYNLEPYSSSFETVSGEYDVQSYERVKAHWQSIEKQEYWSFVWRQIRIPLSISVGAAGLLIVLIRLYRKTKRG
jgi:hypothetical protein